MKYGLWSNGRRLKWITKEEHDNFESIRVEDYDDRAI